jgi:UDP-N-acetyl-D-galactosamine dehydrogenase
MGIDTSEVLEAAGTKWNFLKFKPGLVGGHCIGVDPYYLAQKAQEVGYHPEIILAGRRLNDSMGAYVADEVVKLMVKNDISVRKAKCLILGFTFKENCPDVRNTRVIDIVKELITYNIIPVIFDPWANSMEVQQEYGLMVCNELPTGIFEAAILAVSHNIFEALDIRSHLLPNGVLYDVKGILPKGEADGRL